MQVTVVQARDDQRFDKELHHIICEKTPDPADVLEGKSAESSHSSLRWCAVVHVETSAKYSEMRFATRVLEEDGGKQRTVGCRLHNSGYEHPCDVFPEPSDLVYSENRSGPNTEQCLDKEPFHATWKVQFVRYDVNQVRAESAMPSSARVERSIWWLTVSNAEDKSR